MKNITAIVLFILFTLFLYSLEVLIIKNIKKRKTKELEILSRNVEKEQILFLGDSLTDFYPIDKFFPYIFIYNRGVAGDTTANILNRLDKTVYVLKPKTVYLQIGTNDLMYFKSKDKIVSNIIKIIANLKKNIKNVNVKVISLYPVNRFKNFYSLFCVNVRTNKKIRIINEQISNYCLKENIVYIDLYSHLSNHKNRLDKNYTQEGLHISYNGYQKITSILKNYLEEDLNE